MKSYEKATFEHPPRWGGTYLSREDRQELARNRMTARRLEMVQQEENMARLRWEEARAASRNAKTIRQLEVAEEEESRASRQLDEARTATRQLGDKYYGARNRCGYLVCYVRLPNGTRCPEPAVTNEQFSSTRCVRHDSEKADIED